MPVPLKAVWGEDRPSQAVAHLHKLQVMGWSSPEVTTLWQSWPHSQMMSHRCQCSVEPGGNMDGDCPDPEPQVLPSFSSSSSTPLSVSCLNFLRGFVPFCFHSVHFITKRWQPCSTYLDAAASFTHVVSTEMQGLVLPCYGRGN